MLIKKSMSYLNVFFTSHIIFIRAAPFENISKETLPLVFEEISAQCDFPNLYYLYFRALLCLQLISLVPLKKTGGVPTYAMYF